MMKMGLKVIGSAAILTALLTGGAGQAMAQGFTTLSIGTTFGGGHHHGRHGGHWRGHHGHGSHSNLSLGFSTIITGNPYYSGYYSDPYPYNSYPAYIPSRPVYAAPQAYYSPPPYNGGYQQSSYAPPPANSCLQEREYQTSINIDGNWLPAYGTACLQPDGSWQQGPAQLAQ